ncbi:LapA family protein [Prochlorococcus marinus]|uniref:LapA family protein n=1 Tax=Prochlorococcus marinus TaxID=1219 RepID=UPI0022B3E6E1|nr:LapA family protein [Prochlorococcus marinus]
MQQTNLKAVNFALMFALALLTAYFTLENTASTTINIIPGVSGSLPIAALVIISSGVGACGAWLFASWTDKLRGNEIKELQETKSRMKDLEIDLNRLKTKQNNILPFMSMSNFSSEKESTLDKEVA